MRYDELLTRYASRFVFRVIPLDEKNLSGFKKFQDEFIQSFGKVTAEISDTMIRIENLIRTAERAEKEHGTEEVIDKAWKDVFELVKNTSILTGAAAKTWHNCAVEFSTRDEPKIPTRPSGQKDWGW